jgi:hypothetical protein
MSVTCAPSPCGPALPVARLAGRYSCDYYGHSVAIGLASLRRSHVQQRYTSERDLGVPFVSFNALTGHRSCAPEDYGMLLQFRRRGRRWLQASFRRGTSYPFWRLGFRQSSFRHITRIFPARGPVRLGTAAGFLACYCPLHLSDLGSAIRSRDISSHLCPLRGRYNTAPRGAAAPKYSNGSLHRPSSRCHAHPLRAGRRDVRLGLPLGRDEEAIAATRDIHGMILGYLAGRHAESPGRSSDEQ